MKNILSCLIFIFICVQAFTQDSLYWKKSWQLTTNTTAWNVDSFGNLIISEKDKLQKIDSSGKVTFTQSSKYAGEIQQIDPRNPMKILLFSVEQQLILYLDNTLSKQQESLNLENFDLSFVTQVASSSQADKFWVYDQDNSKIQLITKNTIQQQKIENIKGLLGSYQVIQLIESENNLFIIDRKEGVFQLDTYGTLLNNWKIHNISWAQIEGNHLYYLKDNQFYVQALKGDFNFKIDTPITKATQFKKIDNFIYFSNGNEIHRFSLEIIK